MIVNITALRPGNYFEDEGQIYNVIDIALNKTAMRKMIAKIKVKNLRTGAITEIAHNSGYNVDTIQVEKEKNKFLYSSGENMVFMNNSTYEQTEIAKNSLQWESNFLIPGLEVDIIVYKNEILGIALPAKVSIKIIECDPIVSSNDTVKNQMKNATLETGLKIKVPRFIKNGEVICVKTEDGTYSERVKE